MLLSWFPTFVLVGNWAGDLNARTSWNGSLISLSESVTYLVECFMILDRATIRILQPPRGFRLCRDSIAFLSWLCSAPQLRFTPSDREKTLTCLLRMFVSSSLNGIEIRVSLDFFLLESWRRVNLYTMFARFYSAKQRLFSIFRYLWNLSRGLNIVGFSQNARYNPSMVLFFFSNSNTIIRKRN